MKLSWSIFGGLIGVLAAAVIVVLAVVVVFGGGDSEGSGNDHDGLTAHDDSHIVGGDHDGATGHDDGHVFGADHDGASGHDDGHIVGGGSDHDGATAHDDRHEKGDSHDGDTKHDDNHTSFGPSGGGHNGVVSHDDRHEKGDNHDGDTGHDDEHTVGGDHDGATAHDDNHILGADHEGDTAHDDGHTAGGGHDGATAHDDGHTPSTQAAATPGATAEPAPTSPTPTSPTPTSQPAADSALAAALEYYDAVSDADCYTNNPQNKQCIGLSSQPSTVQGGIAVFGVASPDGPGFVAVLGRDPAGVWRFWRAGQQDYQLLTLPGDALVCAYGARLNVRSEPTTDAPAVGLLDDLTSVRAEEFVLTVQGELQFGYGWFRLSSPLDGWVYSQYLTAALWEDCALHDALEPEF